ncbi:hypothetical protein TVAG_146260 [Trichomonas vaginalis G3]|uniref:receptor protein-tyrosine kinase n=1 Tax=Trichomonas vaginalis (strain ATCC PRA-98 / G3) TaxID=412133 RepID=A2FRC9_TRIV3|nr:glycine-rich protein family [Trichomonas vaginalis G3]EAX92530.1 hypothetical protein TVAG_146260 [Trichomonas vaginalis G3]KAI5494247.1 glycine-rich protein family [Trichomonas vaginalis G3]|eukprot:XP_001305460.1 hypothetical protein [Trichomonas vaginalis G3]
MLSYRLDNPSKGDANVTRTPDGNSYIFQYPCKSYSDCTDYVVSFLPGVYKFELYGSSGGSYPGIISTYKNPDGNCIDAQIVQAHNGNTHCLTNGSRGGTGGYISGIITISHRLTSYVTIGGQGNYSYTQKSCDWESDFYPEKMIKGGYGGGGYASNCYIEDGVGRTGSGGGHTAVKFHKNDLWHRVIVAGAGGGSDNFQFGPWNEDADDGSSGAGGGFIAQGYWKAHNYIDERLANSTFGFTFGSGESAQKDWSKNPDGVQVVGGLDDRPGAGAGWFGGFACHDGNCGAGGGSSFALTRDNIEELSQKEFTAHDTFYNNPITQKYGFSSKDGYKFSEVKTVSCIWEGNGRLIVTVIDPIIYPSCNIIYFVQNHNFLFIFLFFDPK